MLLNRLGFVFEPTVVDGKIKVGVKSRKILVDEVASIYLLKLPASNPRDVK